MEKFHSVTLDTEKCKGCTTCIKHCPTEAIRVRNGKAKIIDERCIDCGECVRVCPNRAKKVVCDSFDMLKNYKYKIALPAPSLYGQFANLDDINIILYGLLKIGFDKVYEVSKTAEMLSDLTRKMVKEGKGERPLISSACPAVVRLIRMRYPNLIKNVVAHLAPVELAAILAKNEAVKETGFTPEEIGVFFISPCPAKVTNAKNPVAKMPPVIDGVLSMKETYKKLISVMKQKDTEENIVSSGIIGVGWATCGGESAALLNDNYLAVDGIDNIIRVLGEIEDDMLPNIDFVEFNACTQGCVGGCLTVENPYVSKMRIKRLMKFLPVSRNKFVSAEKTEEDIKWNSPLEYAPDWQIDDDIEANMMKIAQIEELCKELPGLDCGSCGAPTCRAFAEDLILGFAKPDDCIFRMRERMEYLSGTGDAESYLPPPFRKND